jgi:hypothetical protein
MSNSTTFVNRVTPISAAWLNDVNSAVYNTLGNVSTDGSGLFQITRTGSPATQQAVGELLNVTNNSTSPGYGRRLNYFQTGVQATGFSIGDGVICRFDGTNGGQGLSSWLVTASPTNASNTFGIFCEEFNVINRASDSGYSKTRNALSRWTGGPQIVPEALDLTTNSNNNTYNVTFGLCITHSASTKASDGDYAKQYNGVLIEKDAIAPGGRGLLVSGNSSGISGQNPKYATEVDQTWAAGLYTVSSTFSSGAAGVFGTGQKLIWGTSETDTTGGSLYYDTPTTSLYFDVNSLHTIRVQSVANQINYWQMYGGATGVGANLVASGGDSNIDAIISGKGIFGGRAKDGAGAVKFQWNTTGVSVFGVTPAAQSTGWGTPTGGGVISNFPGATATLAQCSQAIAQLIIDQKRFGWFGV